MTSFRQIEANRRNAFKSTGPKQPSFRTTAQRRPWSASWYSGLPPCCGECAGPSRSRPTCSGSRPESYATLGTWAARLEKKLIQGRSTSCENAEEQADALHERCERLNGRQELDAMTRRKVTYCFLRLANLDNGAVERLGRLQRPSVETNARTLFLLQSTRRR
jgi:hypothetical protein